jgi:hypothetical protein
MIRDIRKGRFRRSHNCKAPSAIAYLIMWNVLMAPEETKKMAEADLDVVIRQLAKQQNKGLMTAVKRRRDRFVSLAAKAKDKETKEKFRQIAKNIMLQGAAAAKRLQISADNAADSYARSMRNAAEAEPAKKPVKKAKA